MNDVDAPIIQIRAYRSEDADGTLAVFLAAVIETASADYSPEQIRVWSRPEHRNVTDWHRARSSLNTYVAVVDGEIAGFSDVDRDGHIEMMFVSPRYARRGAAKGLLAVLEEIARERGARRLSADVSITARPFFESQGFVLQAEQHPVVSGVRDDELRDAQGTGLAPDSARHGSANPRDPGELMNPAAEADGLRSRVAVHQWSGISRRRRRTTSTSTSTVSTRSVSATPSNSGSSLRSGSTTAVMRR